ncbi:MAG: protoporphyrinogen/coproporphyrinogen oxidase [Myxococcota bacterium]
MPAQRIAVIGAGPAGAAAAYALAEAGHDVTVFERDAHIGGRTYTHRAGDDYVDTGAGFITNFYPRALSLADTAGFSDRVKELHRVTGLHRDGELAHLSIGSALSFLRFPFIGLADKWRMAKWTAGLSMRRGRYDIALPETLVDLDHRSIGEMARADLSEAIYHTLVRPGIEPFWYFDCEEVSAALAEALAAHAAGAKFYAVTGGIDHICSALLGELTVHTETSAQGLDFSPDGVNITLSSPDGERTEPFERVVLATTATVARKLIGDSESGPLSPDQRAFLGSQTYAANVHICYRMPRMSRDPGLNAIFPCGTGRAPLAALGFNRRKSLHPPTHPTELVSVYLSDPESLRVMAWSDEALADHGLDLGRTVFPELPQEAEVFHIARRREAIPVHSVGRYRAAVDFQAAQASRDQRVYLCGDYLATATIDGAIATGLRVAEMLTTSE